MPLRTVYAGNPGGVGHQWVSSRYVLPARAWVPFTTAAGGRCVHAPSTYLDNPHLDAEDYRRQLKAACAGDEELFRAWTEGDWSVARGAFFAGSLSPERSEEHTSELQSLMRISYAVFCLKKKKYVHTQTNQSE